MKFGKRVVLDTSTVVSALLRPNSIPRQVLMQAIAMDDLCASESTLRELDEVLQRSKFDRYLELQARKDFAQLYRKRVRLFDVPESLESSLKIPCRDARDNKFLALAGMCSADVIVSSDADLLVLHPYGTVQIATPKQFLEWY